MRASCPARACLHGLAAAVLLTGVVPATGQPGNETTLVITPAHAPDAGSVAVDLRGDCKLHYLNLTYTAYAGGTRTHTVMTDGTYDAQLEKYRYTGRFHVPADAAPGSAVAYAQPYCGPSEEYPASNDVPFTVDYGRLVLAAAPSAVRAGGMVTVSGGHCDGPVSSVALVVRYADGGRQTVAAPVTARRVRATVHVPAAAPQGVVSVALVRPDACPGSRVTEMATFAVLAPSPDRTGLPRRSLSPTPAPALPVSKAPVPTTPGTPVAGVSRSGRRGRPWIAVIVVIAAIGATAHALGRRARDEP